MKKLIGVLAVVLLLVSVFSGCSIMGLFLPVTQEEVDEAFGLSYGSYFASLLVIGFGGEVDGVTIDETTGQMTFSDMDVSESGGDSPYTLISGTFTPSDDETEIYAELTFEGGPVVMMRYTLTEEFMNDSLTAPSATIEVVANYQDFTVTLTNN